MEKLRNQWGIWKLRLLRWQKWDSSSQFKSNRQLWEAEVEASKPQDSLGSPVWGGSGRCGGLQARSIKSSMEPADRPLRSCTLDAVGVALFWCAGIVKPTVGSQSAINPTHIGTVYTRTGCKTHTTWHYLHTDLPPSMVWFCPSVLWVGSEREKTRAFISD